jgi:hypothetical protein
VRVVTEQRGEASAPRRTFEVIDVVETVAVSADSQLGVVAAAEDQLVRGVQRTGE